MSLFDKELVLVMGKGGVGRTTTANALGIAAALSGKQTAIVELNGLGDVASQFGRERSYELQQVGVNLGIRTLTPSTCMEDFGARKLRIRRLAKVLFQSRIAGVFLDAVPGLQDLTQLGKIRNMLRDPAEGDEHCDIVIVDAPATGHGLTLLSAAQSMAEMTRVGRFYEESQQIDVLIRDPEATAIVVTTLPEALPVNESLDFIEKLGDAHVQLAGVVINQVYPNLLPSSPPWETVRSHLGNSAAVALGDQAIKRLSSQKAAIQRLNEHLSGVINAQLPYVPSLRSAEFQQFGATLLDRFSGGS